MRYLRKEVVYDMVVGDSMEEEDTLPAQKVSVDSRSCPSSISPSLATVARYHRVSMVQVSHRDEPVVNNEPGDAVNLEHRATSPLIACQYQAEDCKQHAYIGENHERALRFRKQDCVGYDGVKSSDIAVRDMPGKLTIEVARRIGIRLLSGNVCD